MRKWLHLFSGTSHHWCWFRVEKLVHPVVNQWPSLVAKRAGPIKSPWEQTDKLCTHFPKGIPRDVVKALQGKKKKSELKTNLEKFGLKMKINFSTMGPLCLEYAKVIKNVYREMVMLNFPKWDDHENFVHNHLQGVWWFTKHLSETISWNKD